MDELDLERARARALAGGAPKYHEKNAEQGKLFARERIAHLVDPESFCEDALLANSTAPDLPADGVITGTARIAGRPVAIMANDSTVKAGSWGKRTVEKILRIQETAQHLLCPLLVSGRLRRCAHHRPDRNVPGRRGAGRIFYNQVALSGQIPQLCLLFGPSAAGGAYIPAFCDVVVMVDGNASMYLGSPRMAEMVIGETGHARRDGRRQDAHLGVRLRRRARHERAGGNRVRQVVSRALAVEPRTTCTAHRRAASRRAGSSHCARSSWRTRTRPSICDS